MNSQRTIEVLIIIPAYNEERTIKQVIENLRLHGFNDIVVIDDGSEDTTLTIAQRLGVYTLHHLFNRGLGTALATGLEAAKLLNPEFIVTVDADGQHSIEDIKKVVDTLKKKEADACIGNRTAHTKKMPFKRYLYNKFANLVTFVMYGFSSADTQSGLRGFNRNAYRLISINTSKMEVSSEIIYRIKTNKLTLKEVDIEPIYTPYSLSKGQSFLTGVKTFVRLLLHRFSGR